MSSSLLTHEHGAGLQLCTASDAIFPAKQREVLRTWEDYLSMAKKLHMDVYDEIVYRTRKLRRRTMIWC